MEHYRTTSHTRFDIKLHFVWITKYRKPALTGEVAVRLREVVRQICAEHEVEILSGHVSKAHVHLKVKGKSSRKMLMEFSHLRKTFCGRHLWAGGFFVASSGNVTDEVIMEYIKTQELKKEDGNFKIDS